MADLATLQTRLAEAEEALHKLSCGARVVRIFFKDRSTDFNQTNVPELRAYIGQLRNEIAAAVSPSQSRVFTVLSNRGLS